MLIQPDQLPTRIGLALSVCLAAAILATGAMLVEVVTLTRL